jgi:hypothetical protein
MSWLDDVARASKLAAEQKFNAPERTPEMIANGQVWVAMNNPDDSVRWEIRGTGLAEDED